MPFPLRIIPTLSYKTGGRKFGASRDGGARKHAACDLIAPEGSDVLAIEDGVVLEPAREFYRKTSALVIKHPSGVVRYCEVKMHDPIHATLTKGSLVKAGQVIAHVGKMYHDSMLHFELYKGNLHGPLTVRSGSEYQRRADLMNPTALLDRLAGPTHLSIASQMLQGITQRMPAPPSEKS